MTDPLNVAERSHLTQAAPVRRDVVFTFSNETWTDACNRGMMRPPDRIVSTLLARPDVNRLIVANPFRSAPREFARRLAGKDALFPSTHKHVLVRPLRLRRSDPLDISAVARSYRAYGRSLARSASRLGMENTEVITTHPIIAGFGDLDWANRVTYFGRDDWLSSPARRQYWPVYREAYRRIAESGIAVTAVSEQIIERINPRGPWAVVPNGVEAAEWLGERPSAPEWFASIPSPRAVYVGTLDSRLDVEGIGGLARSKPDLQIVLLGPLADPSYLAPLGAHKNIHVRGSSVGRAEIVAVLRNSELGVVAHRRTPLTEAMSPLKIYEYLAAGCAVISIDLPPVRGLGERVALVESVNDFSDVVDASLAKGVQSEADRKAWVLANSWASRHNLILDVFDN